ncbi:PIN domain-containing protein [Candidatus Collierbacteria bacterium]|nr:PIN domain-containing protein [Candidatus Collierbacteria bacterium]
MVALDTNIVIDHLRRRGNKKSALDRLNERFSRDEMGISMITIQELYEGKSTLDPNKEGEMVILLGSLKIFPYSYEVAKKSGEMARDLGRPIEIPDAAIAATCLVNRCQLATLDKKDFVGIEGLEILEVKV